MANELPNATVLMGDSEFRSWTKAGMVYQARVVILEVDTTTNHANRLALASTVVVNPDKYLDMFVNALACDPAVCGLGVTVGTAISQNLLLQKISDVWNPMANLVVAKGI